MILDNKDLTQEELDRIHDDVSKEIEKAFKFAEESDQSDVEDMLRGVYYNSAAN